MCIKHLLFLTLALVNCAKSIEVLWAYHKASAIVAANLQDGIFTAVSDSEILVCRQGVLSLWNSSGVISDIRLNRPSTRQDLCTRSSRGRNNTYCDVYVR